MVDVRLGIASMIENTEKNAYSDVGFDEFKQAFADGQKVLDEAKNSTHLAEKRVKKPS